MGDEYKILRKLVRRGMRRWWRRQGMLWIVLIIALLACDVVSEVFDLKMLQTMTIYPFNSYLGIVTFIIPPLIGLAFVMLAIEIRDKTHSYCSSTIMIDDKRFHQYVFRFILNNSLVLILLFLVYTITPRIFHLILTARLEVLVADHFLGIICSSLMSVLQYWFTFIIISLVVVARFRVNKTIILVYAAYYLAWYLFGIQALMMNLRLYSWFSLLYNVDDPYLILWRLFCTILIHFAFAYTIVQWLRTRNQRHELTIISILLIVMLSSLHIGCEQNSQLNYYLSILMSLGDLNPISLINYHYYETGTLTLFVFGSRFQIETTTGWSIVSILNSLLMAALYYYAALYLLKLGSTPARGKTLKPAGTSSPALLQSPHDTDAEKPH